MVEKPPAGLTAFVLWEFQQANARSPEIGGSVMKSSSWQILNL
jgi:hypothetical protein